MFYHMLIIQHIDGGTSVLIINAEVQCSLNKFTFTITDYSLSSQKKLNYIISLVCVLYKHLGDIEFYSAIICN